MKKIVLLALAVLVACASLFASPYDDLLKAQDAFKNAKSWQAVEKMPNGHSNKIEFQAPDRWRMNMNNGMMQEVIIGNDAYMIHNGRAMKMPFGMMNIKQMTQTMGFQTDPETKQTAKSLGTQTVNGQSVRVYSFTSHGVPSTLYVGKNDLPVRNVVHTKNGDVEIDYSNYNGSVNIAAP